MKRFIPFFLIIFFAAGVFAQVGTLTVTVASSEPVTGLTNINYEFNGIEGRTYTLTVEVKFDDADYVPIPEDDLSGDYPSVTLNGTAFSGTIEWDGAESFPEIFSDETIVKITADFTWKCGDEITFNYRGSSVTYGSVSKTYTIDDADVTLCWLNRNLGATRPAESSDDHLAYGDLFQWGRGDDGHQDRTSTTTLTLSITDVPGHGEFITTNTPKYDWRDDNNDNRWNANPQENNPCPSGWRVPTEIELNAERQSWGTGNQNSDGAFASKLKWPVGGYRYSHDGDTEEGSDGRVWSSSVSDASARYLYFGSGSASMSILFRANGSSVRCVRDN